MSKVFAEGISGVDDAMRGIVDICEQIDPDTDGGSSLQLGIMGGTFDPIHLGHLSCAERAREALGLDTVLFIPAGDPAFKQGRRIADADARYSMCELAVADNPSFQVSDVEIRRNGITYTVDTLDSLRRICPHDVVITFIIGTDSLEALHEWKDAPRLAKMARFACVSRPGYIPEAGVIDRLSAIGFEIEFVEAPMLDISSSAIRRLCASGSSIRYLVPNPVREFIVDNGLYAGDVEDPERRDNLRSEDDVRSEGSGV